MDEADQEMEIVSDPFLDAGIVIPEELPYVKPDKKRRSVKKRLSAISRVLDRKADLNSDNVSIAGSLAPEITQNSAKTISTIIEMNQFHKKLSKSNMYSPDVEASINLSLKANESGDKDYRKSMPAMRINESKPSLQYLDTIDSEPASPEEPGITLDASAVISDN